MARRFIWHGTDLTVLIFKEDENGDPIGMADPDVYNPELDTPLLTYCFWRQASVSGELEINRRKVTGHPVGVLSQEAYDYTASTDSMYFKYSEVSREKIFERATRLRMVFRNYNPIMIPPTGETNDEQHIMKHCLAKSWSIEHTENDVSRASAAFWGEEFPTPVGYEV